MASAKKITIIAAASSPSWLHDRDMHGRAYLQKSLPHCLCTFINIFRLCFCSNLHEPTPCIENLEQVFKRKSRNCTDCFRGALRLSKDPTTQCTTVASVMATGKQT